MAVAHKLRHVAQIQKQNLNAYNLGFKMRYVNLSLLSLSQLICPQKVCVLLIRSLKGAMAPKFRIFSIISRCLALWCEKFPTCHRCFHSSYGPFAPIGFPVWCIWRIQILSNIRKYVLHNRRGPHWPMWRGSVGKYQMVGLLWCSVNKKIWFTAMLRICTKFSLV